MWKTTSQNDLLLTLQFSFQDSVIHETKTLPAVFDIWKTRRGLSVGWAWISDAGFEICRTMMYQWLPSIKHRKEGNKRRNHLFSLNFFGLCKEGARGLSLRKMWWKSASLLPHLRSEDLTRSLKKLGFTWCVDKQGRLFSLLLPFTIFFLLGVSCIHLGIR